VGTLKREIAAGEFKAKCLALLDEVSERREEIVITKRGTPVARLVPIDNTPPKIFGRMAGSVVITGDIVNSLDEEWDAMKDDDSTTPFIGHALLGVGPKRTKK
jgi:prevent-host-death family protein